MDKLYSQQCPTVCAKKKEGGDTLCLQNQPHRICEMKQLDGDGISPILKGSDN